MALEPVLRAHSFRQRIRASWMAISATALGDALATAIAIGGIFLLFLACAFGAIGVIRACSLALRVAGAG